MQQKIEPQVHLQIKLFEGKAPPDSWVNENIVRHLQIQSQRSLLTDVLNYVHELQSDQLAKTKGQAPIKESFAEIPEKAAPHDISQKAIYNSTQGYLKTEMEFLEDLITTLKQGGDKDAELDSLLAQLKGMAQSFPKLVEKDLYSLTQIWNKVLSTLEKAPFAAKRAFWNKELNMLQALMQGNKANLKELQEKIQNLNSKAKNLGSLDEVLQKIQAALAAKPPSEGQLLELIEHLQDLANQSGQLKPEQNQLLSQLFGQLDLLKTSKGESFGQVIANVLLRTKVAEFLNKQPNASVDQIKKFLKQYLDESNLQSSNLKFMSSLGNLLDETLEKKDFPAIPDYSEADLESGNVQSSIQQLRSETATETSTVAGQIEGYKTASRQLTEIQKQLSHASIWSVGESLKTGHTLKGSDPTPPADSGNIGGNNSLPWEFQNAVLNHFMPMQEMYLQMMALNLFAINGGADFGNTLLNDMLGFGNANIEFNSNNWLKGNPPDFSGDAKAAQAALNQEIQACQNAINQLNGSITDTTNEINKLQAELKDTKTYPIGSDARASIQSQYNNLTGPTGVLAQETTNLHQLTDPKTGLLARLNDLTITAVTPKNKDDPPQFTVTSKSGNTSWQSNLTTQEGFVVNGNPDPKSPCPGVGLIKLQGNVNAYQQQYQSLGQTQQMTLQLHMTEFSQELQAVTTAMTIINQMYMALAQAFYK